MDEMLKSCKMIGGIVTVENAEEHYKNSCGDMYSHDGSAMKFYKQHFTKEDFLKWNVEIVKRKIDEYKEADKIIYNKAEEGWKHFFDLAYLVYKVYVEDKNLYLQRIELLKKLYKDYGYFMNYSSVSHADVSEIYIFVFNAYCYWDYPIHVESDRYHNEYEEPTNSGYFDSSRTRTGLIPDLYYLGYYDLLDKYLEECFLPICLNYREKNKFYKRYKMFYIEDEEGLEDAENITKTVKFLREQNYKLPKELDEFWKKRGI